MTSLEALIGSVGLMPKGIYSLEEVSRILGVSEPALKVMIRRGHLRPLRRSLRRFAGIEHTELATYLEKVNQGGGR